MVPDGAQQVFVGPSNLSISFTVAIGWPGDSTGVTAIGDASTPSGAKLALAEQVSVRKAVALRPSNFSRDTL